MRTKLLAIGSTLLLVAGLISVGAGPAVGDDTHGNPGVGNDGKICELAGATKIDIEDGVKIKTLEITAPEGQLIDAYCVKAGSGVVGDGPEYTNLDVAVSSVTLSHTTGKNLSHYAVHYVTDLCPNIPDAQDPIPGGMVLDDEGNCVIEPPIEVSEYATATVDLGGASCDAAGSVTKGAIENATWNGDIVVTDGHYSVSATAVDGHTFEGGDTTVTLTGDVATQLPSQSTDPEGDCYIAPPPTVQQCSVITDAPVSTNIDPNGWYFTDSKSEGHHAYVEGGLHIWTDSSSSEAKSAGMIDTNIPLSQIGVPSLTYLNTSGLAEPGINLELTVDGTRIGVLAFEPLFDYWWTSHEIDGMPKKIYDHTYQKAFGSLNDFLAAYAANGAHDVMITGVGFSLGSSAHGDGIITGITAGCVNYTFDHQTLVVTPEAPTFHDECSVQNDVLTVPEDTADVTYKAAWNSTHTRVKVTATPTTDRVFPEHTKYEWAFVPNDEVCPLTVVTPVKPDVSMIDECDVDHDSLTVNTSTEGVKYTTTWSGLVATVTASITDSSKYEFADGAQRVWTFTFTNVPCLTEVTPADPAVNEVCVDNTTSGTITVDLQKGIDYTIDGEPVTAATTTVKPGMHTVEATARDGYILTGDAAWPYKVTVSGQACGQLPSHANVTPVVTWSNLDCNGNGSYTLANIKGVLWSVDGVPTHPGTYPVKSAQTVHITAAADGPDFALEFEAQTDWKLEFTVPEDCPLQLTTLALPDTGVDGNGINLGLLFSSSLMLLGGALIYVERRLRFGRN